MQQHDPEGRPGEGRDTSHGAWWPWPNEADPAAGGAPRADASPGAGTQPNPDADATASLPVNAPVQPDPTVTMSDAPGPRLSPPSPAPAPVPPAPAPADPAPVPASPVPATAPRAPGAASTAPEPAPAVEVSVPGTQPVGSIPAVSGRRVWLRSQWVNWRLYLVRAVSAGLSVIVVVAIVPGLSFVEWRWGQGLEIAVIFALLNAFVKPALQFLSLRFLFSSYGIVIVLINTLLLLLLGWILPGSIQATTILSVLVGGALIGILGGALDAGLGADYPTLDRDYKERNGLL